VTARADSPAAAAAPSLAERLRSGPAGRVSQAVRTNRKASIGLLVLLFFVLLALFPGVIAKDDPSADVFAPALGPSLRHLLGTTSYGQDIFAQVVYGTRESLVIALLAGFLATALAVLVGVTAAYVGGIIDHILSLVTDIFLVVPTFPLIIVIAAYTKNAGDGVLITVLVVTGWSYGARTLRVQTLSLRGRDFLVAAQLRGEQTWRIITHEVLPNMTSLIVANFLGAALYSVLAAAGLEFVGLGNPQVESWGTMLYWAQNQEALQSGMPLWVIAPGVCIALLGAGFALLNYAFDEIGNPALRPVSSKRVTRGSRVG
jgi:peptide/nickel transport system permease protein